MTHPAITIRAATPDDGEVFDRLATLDNHRRPPGQTLLAEADGNLIAAIALTSGDVGNARSLLRRFTPPLAKWSVEKSGAPWSSWALASEDTTSRAPAAERRTAP
jgi:hypothetical protein